VKKRFAVFVLVFSGCLAAGAFEASASTIISSFAQGWVNAQGNGNGAGDGNNTFTGYSSTLYNSWAAFNIPTGTFGSASLNLMPDTCCATQSENINIYDVTTLFAALQGSTGGVAAYNDLGSGSLYGAASLLSTPVSVLLSAQALTNIDASAGNIFIIGFMNTSVTPSGSDNGIYTNGSSSANAPQLVLTQPVPEPASIALLGIGLTALAFIRRRTTTC
jgi:hypothetical protein